MHAVKNELLLDSQIRDSFCSAKFAIVSEKLEPTSVENCVSKLISDHNSLHNVLKEEARLAQKFDYIYMYISFWAR